MKIISYSFDVPEITSQNVEKIKYIIKSIDMQSETAGHLAEVIITTASHDKNYLLEEALAEEIIRSTSTRVVASDKRSKAFTRPTLVADIFLGDILIMTRTSQQMSELIFQNDMKKNFLDENLSHHLTFLLRKNNLDGVDCRLYAEINKRYDKILIPENTFGFIASRQSINSVMAAERDIYDLFISLAVSNIDRKFKNVSTDFTGADSLYTDHDRLELLAKFSNTSYYDHFSKTDKILLIGSLILSLAIVAFSYYLSAIYLSFIFIFASFALYLVIDAVHSHLSTISRQSFAAANKKYVAGNAVVYQINKKN